MPAHNSSLSTILITGITGFVATRAALRLLEDGYRVTGVARRQADIPGVDAHVGDITDPDAMRRAMQGVDAVIHCAASFSSSFVEAARVNIEGTHRVAQAALDAGCQRFVHISSCGVYNLAGVDVVEETTPMWDYDPDSRLVYGVTKAEAERVLMTYHEGGLPVVILRPPNITGSHEQADIGHYARQALAGKLTYGGEGDFTWPYVYVENLIDAVRLALTQPQAAGQAYTIVDGHITWRAYAEQIAALTGGSVTSVPPRAPYDYFTGQFSSKKARQHLGYSPRFTYDDAMAEQQQYLKELGLLLDT
jgi:nucleoside-diphosphate-sugar epimerase